MNSSKTVIAVLLVVFGVFGSLIQGHEKRAAILSPQRPFSSESNEIKSVFITKKVDYHSSSRSGRNLFNETSKTSSSSSTTTSETLPPDAAEATKNSTPQSSDPSDDTDEGRKASPDVQDIIDGIVKLLGGKVHPGAPAGASSKEAMSSSERISHIHHNHNNNQPLQRQPMLPPQPPRVPITTHIPPASYNLFQPQQPLGKPSRINNRGPPVVDPRPLKDQTSVVVPQQQQQQQQQTHFISKPQKPADYPPQQYHHQSQSNLQNQYYPPPHHRPQQSGGGTVRFPQDTSFSSAEQQSPSLFEAIPLEALGNHGGNPGQKIGPPFPLPPVGYRPPQSPPQQQQQTSTIQPPYKKGIPLPEQLVPLSSVGAGGTNGQWPKVPSPPTIPPPLSSNEEINANKKPGTLLVPAPTTLPPHYTYTDDDDDDEEQDQYPEHQYPQQPSLSPASIEREPVRNFGQNNQVPSPSFDLFPSSTISEEPTPSSPTDFSTAFSASSPSVEPSSVSVIAPSSTSSVLITSTPPVFDVTTSRIPQFINKALQSSSAPTPPLRPGIVLNDKPTPGQGYGSIEVVTADAHGPPAGEVFDITVTAKQNYGQVTGQPFVIPVDLKDEVITQPKGDQQYVSIDGKRQYFNLHPNNGAVVGSVAQTQLTINPAGQPAKTSAHGATGTGSVSASPLPIRPVSTQLTIHQPQPHAHSSTTTGGGNDKSVIQKAPPNIIRRPITRKPVIPPIRIDTCIVGDDSTCNTEAHEVCRTENGVSSCMCRAGYARRRHREPCKAVVAMVVTIKLDKLGDKKLSYNPDYFNPNTETYQTLEWETIHGLDAVMQDTTLQSQYVGSKLEAIGFDGRHAVVNTTVLLQETPKANNNQVKRELQRQLIQSLTRSRNNFGKSQLWVEGPISAVAAIEDVNECESPEQNDCHSKAKCINTFGSFECKCDAGYGDPHASDKRLGGRRCDSCSGKVHCNGRGECLIENGQKKCKCSGNYYGSACDIDGEVLAVAIGASVSAIVIIGLTLVCLCMWSRRWKKEEQKAAIMSRTVFGGMASSALSYLGKQSMAGGNNPYQAHLTLDDRLRWAQVNDPNLTSNIYVQNEPMSLYGHTTMMDSRRSAETLDTTVDDFYDDRHHANSKRPRSRSSQLPPGGIYYDLEPQSEMYPSSPMVNFPAQFSVPMSPYARGFYN